MNRESNDRVVTESRSRRFSKVQTKILVNASTLVVGGGIQIGKSFIEYASRLDEKEFKLVFVVSEAIYDSLSTELQEDERVKLVRRSPARILRGHRSRSFLKKLEAEFRPDIVYTLGLPSYTRFRSTEVGRYTNPWEIHPTPLAWSLMPTKERVALLIKTRYRLFWARRASYFETQTEAAKAGMVKRLGMPGDRIKVIPNAPNPLFRSMCNWTPTRPASDRTIVFCLAAPYRHKHLTIIPQVARCLKSGHQNRKFSFITTLPEDNRINVEIGEKSKRLGVDKMITNVGHLKLEECVRWYQDADIVFLPTLLEVFSATYVEAMAMSRPIVTSDLDFARSICDDAAMYYEPQSPLAAAEAIMAVVSDSGLRGTLVDRGRRRLAMFPDADEKHRMVFDWLRSIAVGNRY